MKARYLIFHPDPQSKTAWEAELAVELPNQLPDIYVEQLVFNLVGMKQLLLERAGEASIKAFKSKAFAVSEVCEILELNKNTLHEWIKRDLVRPSVRAKSGKGNRLLFGGLDLFRLSLFQRISDRGAFRSGARGIVQNLDFSKTILGE
jgi:hypothetical protein